MPNLIGFTWRKTVSHSHTNQAPASFQCGPSPVTGRPRWEHAPAFSKRSHSTDTCEKPTCSHGLQWPSMEKLRAQLANVYSYKLLHFSRPGFSTCLLSFTDWSAVICAHWAHNRLLRVLCVGLILESRKMGRITNQLDVQFTGVDSQGSALLELGNKRGLCVP